MHHILRARHQERDTSETGNDTSSESPPISRIPILKLHPSQLPYPTLRAIHRHWITAQALQGSSCAVLGLGWLALHWLLDEALLGDHGSGFLGFGTVGLLGGRGLVVGFLVGGDGSFGFDRHGEEECGGARRMQVCFWGDWWLLRRCSEECWSSH